MKVGDKFWMDDWYYEVLAVWDNTYLVCPVGELLNAFELDKNRRVQPEGTK